MEIKNFKDFMKLFDTNKLKSPILIYGDEPYLIKRGISAVLSQITQFPELNISTLESDNITLDNIINALETIPFMSDKKLVYIKNPDFMKKTDKKGSKEDIGDDTSEREALKPNISAQLSELINSTSEDVVILISYSGEVGLKDKLAQTAKNKGLLVQLNELKGLELQNYSEEIFKANGKNISKADLVYFISEVGTSLSIIENEIKKLCIYQMDSDSIIRKDIDAICSKTAESNIFKMVDSISKKDASSAIVILNTLLFQKEEHIRILGMIIRQYRLLLMIKLYMKNNTPATEIQVNLKLRDFAYNSLAKLSSLYTETSIKNALNYCLNTDVEIKYSNISPDLSLEMLLVQLCK